MIPVANLYYLLCYAWDEFAPLQMSRIAAEEFSDTLQLFSRLLVLGIRALHRRGLETGYLPFEEPTATLRGRCLMRETMQLRTTQPKKIYCSFDELSPDILTNQILKSTVKRLLGVESLGGALRAELRSVFLLLGRVREIELDNGVFRRVRLHQNNRFYSFLVTVCRFIHESMSAQDRAGRYQFRDVDRDERRMRRVFEKFVRNFFARRQQTFSVQKERFEWSASAIDDSDLAWLPRMETDVTLRSTDRTVVIECKYTESLFESRFFKEKLRPPHLYQLCAYLRNLERNDGPDQNADGILLYPTAGVSFDQSYVLHGHRVRIKTMDLNQPWAQIEAAMLSLL